MIDRAGQVWMDPFPSVEFEDGEVLVVLESRPGHVYAKWTHQILVADIGGRIYVGEWFESSDKPWETLERMVRVL